MEKFSIVRFKKPHRINGDHPIAVFRGDLGIVYKGHLIAVAEQVFFPAIEGCGYSISLSPYEINIRYLKNKNGYISWEQREVSGNIDDWGFPLPIKLLYLRASKDAERWLRSYPNLPKFDNTAKLHLNGEEI